MGKQRGYTDEGGNWVEPMSKAEAKASVEDMGKFVAFMREQERFCECRHPKSFHYDDHGNADACSADDCRCWGYVVPKETTKDE